MSIEQKIEFCQSKDKFRKAFSSFVGDAKSIFIVHGHRSYQSCGAKELVSECTKRLNIIDFEDFTENPKMEDVEKGVMSLRDADSDLIIAIGGGSAMDMAKLIRFYSHSNIKLLAIPTTAGTGAESTQFAVCYIDGVKHSISDESILPEMVLLYPAFTHGNSRYLTSCTGFDALAQAIEAYWNINSNEESDKYAEEAISYIYPVLTKEKLSTQDRASLMKGANLAGKAINITRTTVPHALSYTLTSKYGYPHGHAVALTFPFFLKYNLEGNEERFKGTDFCQYAEKMEQLCSLLEIKGDPFESMKGYIKQLGLNFDPMKDFNDSIVAQGINLERAKNTPIAIDEEVILNAVKSIRN